MFLRGAAWLAFHRPPGRESRTLRRVESSYLTATLSAPKLPKFFRRERGTLVIQSDSRATCPHLSTLRRPSRSRVACFLAIGCVVKGIGFANGLKTRRLAVAQSGASGGVVGPPFQALAQHQPSTHLPATGRHAFRTRSKNVAALRRPKPFAPASTARSLQAAAVRCGKCVLTTRLSCVGVSGFSI